MKTKKRLVVTVLTAVSALLVLTACADVNRNWSWVPQTLHEGQYLVVGKVTSMQAVPIDQTRVYLMKRFYRDPDGWDGWDKTRPDDHDTQHLVVTTDPSGEFAIAFELLGADDVWLYIDASNQGYKPRFVNLNERMGDSFFSYPGHRPISVHVVLEQEQRRAACD